MSHISVRDRSDEKVTAGRVGHSTVIINFFGTRILTDPVLFDKIGLHWGKWTAGLKRYTPAAITLEDIPQIDVILLSHMHFDHFDTKSIRALATKFGKNAEVVLPKNTSRLLHQYGFKAVHELDRNEEKFVNGLYINAYEVKHWGARIPLVFPDRFYGSFQTGHSYNSYIIQKKSVEIGFLGDTAYLESMSEIKKKHTLTAVIAPIGAYKHFQHVHCNPYEAAKMVSSMGAPTLLPVHRNTFKLSLEPAQEPIQLLKIASEEHGLSIGRDTIGGVFEL